MENLFKRRFQELADQALKLEASKHMEYDPLYNRNEERIDSNALLNWKVKAKALLVSACGEDSQHFKFFEESESSPFSSNLDNLGRMKAVFDAAREDFEGGYLTSLRTLVQAEVFDSELEQATELLQKGYELAAAVISGTVLETALRELCDRNQIPHGKLDKMNADLAKKNIYNANMAKRITALAAIRNSAAHGKSNEFSADDVKSMIEDIGRFLTHYL